MALKEMATIVENQELLGEVIELAKNCDPAPDVSKLSDQVAASSGRPANIVHGIISAFSNLHRLQLTTELDADQLISSVTESLELSAPKGWKTKYLKKWKGLEKALVAAMVSLGDNNAVYISEKAGQLTISHQYVVVDANIITDLRHVFNDSGDKILEALVTHSLILSYLDGGKRSRMHFTMDARDIADLKKLCDRAQTKAATLEIALRDSNWKTVIVRDQEND